MSKKTKKVYLTQHVKVGGNFRHVVLFADHQLENIIIMEQEHVSVVVDFSVEVFKVSNFTCLFVQRTQHVIWNRNRENVAKNVDLKNA